MLIHGSAPESNFEIGNLSHMQIATLLQNAGEITSSYPSQSKHICDQSECSYFFEIGRISATKMLGNPGSSFACSKTILAVMCISHRFLRGKRLRGDKKQSRSRINFLSVFSAMLGSVDIETKRFPNWL